MVTKLKQGFTLLELSIVLVIIGLIIGGITVGADLIKSAELNSAISDVSKMKLSINTFKLKYNAFPGDMKNAGSYWGAGTGACSSNTAICNGDGNGKIGGSSSEWLAQTEFVGFWKHLEESEIIEWEPLGSNARRAFKNLPNTVATIGHKQPLSYAYWSISDPNLRLKGKHGLYLTANDTTGTLEDGEVAVIDLNIIDTKMDDGTPAAGDILAKDGANTATGKSCAVSGVYNLSEATQSNTCTAMWYIE